MTTPPQPATGEYAASPAIGPVPAITASPSRIGDIARAALVLTHFEHGYIT